MRNTCPQGHNKLETGFHADGRCKVCRCKQTTKWVKANPDKARKYHTKSMQNYRRTLRGFLDQKYTAMSKRVRGLDKNCIDTMKGLPIVPRVEFLEWCKTRYELVVMFAKYKASGFQFKWCPTIDRINSNLGYTFGNMQFLYQFQNAKKGRSNMQFNNSYGGTD